MVVQSELVPIHHMQQDQVFLNVFFSLLWINDWAVIYDWAKILDKGFRKGIRYPTP